MVATARNYARRGGPCYYAKTDMKPDSHESGFFSILTEIAMLIQQAHRPNTRALSLAAFAIVFLFVKTNEPIEAAEPAIKNVLFIVADDLRANVLGCYGNKICDTPNIDKLAKQAVVFEKAYCQGTVCGPSRTSFMFGRYQGRGDVTIGQHFKQNGYYSARAGKIFHMRVPGDIIAGTDGQDIAETWTERFNSQGNEAHTPGDYACLNLNIFTTELEGRQSTKMPNRMFVSVQYDGDGSDQPDHKTATKTIELLQKHKKTPFFLAAGFVRPHYPMVAPRQYFAPYDWQKITLPELLDGDLDDMPAKAITNNNSVKNGFSKYPDNQKRTWAAYYAAVTFMDAQVGRVVDELDRLGLRESTAIVFTSDHGYHLGDHTFWQKNNIHEQVIRVPLMISAPGFAAGRSSSIAELVDLFPTLCDLTGVQTPTGQHGTSLTPVMHNKDTVVKDAALSFAKGTSWRTKDFAYMNYGKDAEELYDMRTDPNQFTNLAGNPKFDKVRKQLQRDMQAKLAATGPKKPKKKATKK